LAIDLNDASSLTGKGASLFNLDNLSEALNYYD